MFLHSRLFQSFLTENLPRRRVFRDNVDHVFGHHDLIEFNDIGVVKQFEHFNLTQHFLQIGLIQFALVNDFNGNLKVLKIKKKNLI